MGLAIQATGWITEIGIGIAKRSHLSLYAYGVAIIATLGGILLLVPMLGLMGVGIGVMIRHCTCRHVILAGSAGLSTALALWSGACRVWANAILRRCCCMDQAALGVSAQGVTLMLGLFDHSYRWLAYLIFPRRAGAPARHIARLPATTSTLFQGLSNHI